MSDQTRRNATRRGVLKGASAMALAGCTTQPQRRATGARPNIVFIMADDLGYADLSCYGRREYQTPAVDGLAADGVRFLQAYANSAVCSATRTALITGRYQYRLAVGLEEPLQGARDVGLPPDHPTLPGMLRQAGYQTALVGKWHLGRLPNFGPLKSGYDRFWGFREGSIDYFTHDGFGNRPDLWDGDAEVEAAGYLTDLLGAKSVDVIEDMAKADKPFFLSLHFNAPHWPWEGPNDEMEAKRLAAIGGRAIFHLDSGSLKTYGEIVTAMDRQVGRVVGTLDRLGITDNTIVVFTSDNGGERFSNTWPFTGKKTELLEGGLRIPLIVRWPGLSHRGSVSDQTAMSMDWLPTLLAAAGASPYPDFAPDGVDLRDAIGGGAPAPRDIFFRYLHMRQEAYRSGDWKYLKIGDNTFLFDVARDPLERANLKNLHPDVYERMVARYRAWDATMLPLDPAAQTHGYSGDMLADHFSSPD